MFSEILAGFAPGIKRRIKSRRARTLKVTSKGNNGKEPAFNCAASASAGAASSSRFLSVTKSVTANASASTLKIINSFIPCGATGDTSRKSVAE